MSSKKCFTNVFLLHWLVNTHSSSTVAWLFPCATSRHLPRGTFRWPATWNLNNKAVPQVMLWLSEELFNSCWKICDKHGFLIMHHRKLAIQFYSERSDHSVKLGTGSEDLKFFSPKILIDFMASWPVACHLLRLDGQKLSCVPKSSLQNLK